MDIQKINEQLLFKVPEKQTDVGLLCGARSVSGEVARHGAALYHRHAFRKIIVTGGIPVRELIVLGALLPNFIGIKKPKLHFTDLSDFTSSKREADHMKAVLLENNVPESDIIFVDNQSQHTGANIENTRSRLHTFNSIAIVSTAYSQRRVLGTLRHDSTFTQPVVTFPVYPFGFTRDNWHHTLIRGIVALESKRIDSNDPQTYVGKHCINPNIDNEIHRASHLPNLKLL